MVARQRLARDDELLHFACALVDAQRADLAVQPFGDRPARDAERAVNCTVRSMTRCAVSVAVSFAIAASRVVGSFSTSRTHAARYVSSALASIPVAISAIAACVSWRSASVPPNIVRDVARASASSSARRARPSAAAATLARNTSSERIASLNPSPLAPSRFDAGTRHARKRSVASGCGAMRSTRSAISNPAASASTTNALSPRLPSASPVRANTT